MHKESVTTANQGDIGSDHDSQPCPICGADLKRRQKYCSDRCRLKGFRVRQVERIIDKIRIELIKEIVK